MTSLKFPEPPMPKNKVSDPITDQEIAFARLVLSGAMTDRRAAEAVGLNPDSAAYTKSKPRVRAYMLEHRAAVQQQLVQQEAERTAPPEPGPRTSTGPPLGNRQPQPRNDPRQHYRPGQGPLDDRGHAKLHPRPSRRLLSEKKSAPAPATRKSMPPLGVAPQQATTIDPQPSPAPAQQEQEDVPACPGVPRKPKLAPGSVGDPPPDPGPSQSTFANRFTPSEAPPPYVPLFTSVPDLGVPFSIKKNPFVRPR